MATKTKTQDSAKLPFTAEATPLPTDESAARLQEEADKLHAPGQVGKTDAEFIDPDPGYHKDHVAHMREYYGLD